MYCPSCGEKYGWTVFECPECGSELVEQRPGPPPEPEAALTPIFRTGDAALIALAKSLLDAEHIEYLVRADALQDLFGFGRFGTNYSVVVGPAEFVVREDDAERAKELLENLSASAVEAGTPGRTKT